MQICPVHHGSKRGIPHTQFAGNAEISVLFHSSSIQLYCASLTRSNHVFQHLFVLLQQPMAAVIAQNAKEHVLVVCEMRHTLDDIDVRMLRPLARCVFRPSPHDNLAHFVQNTVGLFKVPACAPPTRSGKWVLSISSRDTLFLCNSYKSLTDTFHSRLSIFHSRASRRTSVISLLGSTTGGTLNRGESLSLDPALIFLFSSYTWYITC